MTQAKVLGGKRVPHFTRPRIQGMACKARLHPNRVDLLPKMVVGIADNFQGHDVRQGVGRLIMDRNVDHRDTPRAYGVMGSPSKVLLYLVTLCLPQGATILWRRGKDVDSAGES